MADVLLELGAVPDGLVFVFFELEPHAVTANEAASVSATANVRLLVKLISFDRMSGQSVGTSTPPGVNQL